MSQIGSTIGLSPPPDPSRPMDEDYDGVVYMPAGTGSWPHRHPPQYHHHRELEAFWHRNGQMNVCLRPPGGEWEILPLDANHPWVLVPPGWEHGIYTRGLVEPASFSAFTIQAHINDIDQGGNVYRSPIEALPNEVLNRVRKGLIK